MVVRKIIIIATLMFLFNLSFAQISPPGLGKANTASWFAIGLKQSLDSASKKQSVTYLALGRKSNPESDVNPFRKQGIWVLNQEFSNHYTKNWQYSYGISYRRQTEYADDAPFEKEGIQQEFRVYGKYSYLRSFGRFKWTNTFRQEFRKFYLADFSKSDENLQLRTRLKTQLVYNLTEKGNHRLMGSAESLFATSLKNYPTSDWTKFAYKESRFALYYSTKITNTPYTFDIGYMNDLVGTGSKVNSINYIAVDLIWNNPFTKRKK